MIFQSIGRAAARRRAYFMAVTIGCGFIIAALTACNNSSTLAPAPLMITSGPPPTAVVGKEYLSSLFASGGADGYTWSWSPAAGSSLPPGLSLMLLPLTPPGKGYQGAISGTPTTEGTFKVVVTVTDFEAPPQHARATYTITVVPAPPPPSP